MKIDNSFKCVVLNSAKEDTAEIELSGDVVSTNVDWWTGEVMEGCISPEVFNEALKSVEGKRVVNIKLSTFGGDVNVGMGIYNKLCELTESGVEVNVILNGVVASAGTVIASAGNIIAKENSMFMIHEVKSGVMGYYSVDELKQIENSAEAWNKAIANIYEKKTHLTNINIRNMMKRETWLVGQEIVEKGFANKLENGGEQLKLVACADKNIVVNKDGVGINLPTFLPERVKSKFITESVENNADNNIGDNASIIAEDNNNGGISMEIKTIDELKSAYPDLCNQLVNSVKTENETVNKTETENAVKAERERIKQINAIAFKIADKTLVEKAMFENGATAADLLMADAMAEKERMEKMQNAIQNDTENSGVNNVTADVSDTNADVVNAEQTARPLTREEKIARGKALAKGGK